MYNASQIKPGTALYAKKDGVAVYSSADTNSSKLQFAADGSGNYREYKKGDFIGFVPDSWDGNLLIQNGSQWLFILTRYWKKRLFDSIRDNAPAYLRINEDSFVTEADFSIIEAEVAEDEKAVFSAELLKYTSGLPVNERPVDWFKDAGKWVLKFQNGSTVGFEEYKKLSNTERAKFGGTTGFGDSFLGNGTGTNKSSGTGTSFFTTTNILIGVGILAALGVVLFLIFRKNGTSKRK